MPTKTQREREQAQREEKLDRMKEQVDDGSLTIRKMTAEEKARFKPRRAPQAARKRAAPKTRSLPPKR
jgi:DNA-binding protein H-NS